jgi:hypothetical protein
MARGAELGSGSADSCWFLLVHGVVLLAQLGAIAPAFLVEVAAVQIVDTRTRGVDDVEPLDGLGVEVGVGDEFGRVDVAGREVACL